MKVIKPSYEIINEPNWGALLVRLEGAGRTCYKSEDKITEGSSKKMVANLLARGHESVIEHEGFSVRFVCDRGVSHELVRHRLCSFSQESTRYVNYGGEDIQFILPPWLDDDLIGTWTYDEITDYCAEYPAVSLIPSEYKWLASCDFANSQYDMLIKDGWKPEQARSVLPNSLKTEIVVTTNLRDWRHIFSLRCDKTAHPQMRELMVPLYLELVAKCPTLFKGVKFSIHKDDWHLFPEDWDWKGSK